MSAGVAGAAYVFAMLVAGFFTGGLVGGRLLASGMGVDRIADALGGVMVGTGLGAVIALATLGRLSVRGRWVGAGAAFGLALLAFGVVRLLSARG